MAAADPMVKLMQDSLNQVLAGAKCRGIGADGKLGPETCGAMSYVANNLKKFTPTPQLLYIQGNAPSLFGRCTSGSYQCQAGAAAPAPAVTTAAAPPMPLPRRGMSTSNMVMLGSGLIAVAVVGFAVAKKKGWIA